MSDHSEGVVLDRRRFMLGATGAVASAGLAKTLVWPGAAGAASLPSRRRVQPAPNPIPGGIQIPGGPLIHVHVPGPTNITLPFSGLQLEGLDVEPTTITDFKGSTALGYVVGAVTGSDGKTYNLEADIRAFEGEYMVDGTTFRGSFGFV